MDLLTRLISLSSLTVRFYYTASACGVLVYGNAANLRQWKLVEMGRVKDGGGGGGGGGGGVAWRDQEWYRGVMEFLEEQ